MTITSTGGIAPSATGTGWNRLGPKRREGDARVPQTGSVSTRMPSISIRTVEWPSHVALRPLFAVLDHAALGSIDGNGLVGTRRSLPQRKSDIEGGAASGSRRPGMIGWRLRNPSPDQ